MEQAREFGQKVALASSRWEAAERNAIAKARRGVTYGGRVLTPAELKDLHTARKLLSTALDPAAGDAEAALALSKFQAILDRLKLAVPEKAAVRCLELGQAKRMRALSSGTR